MSAHQLRCDPIFGCRSSGTRMAHWVIAGHRCVVNGMRWVPVWMAVNVRRTLKNQVLFELEFLRITLSYSAVQCYAEGSDKTRFETSWNNNGRFLILDQFHIGRLDSGSNNARRKSLNPSPASRAHANQQVSVFAELCNRSGKCSRIVRRY